jgi:hypothetical protein
MTSYEGDWIAHFSPGIKTAIVIEANQINTINSPVLICLGNGTAPWPAIEPTK